MNNLPTLVLEAAEAILNGEIVVMPTETVYGLAADASNPEAIGKVFAAKGRPLENPLIAHVASIEMAKSLTTVWDQRAQALAEAFWPGPLSMVLPRKRGMICDLAAANLDSVAIRMPDHPVAMSLLESCGRALCAPSANRFAHLSATQVRDLDQEMIAATSVVLDGGPCKIGIESTVVSLLSNSSQILRKGIISEDQIQSVLGGTAESSPGPQEILAATSPNLHLSPGQYAKHYAPDAVTKLVDFATCDTALLFGRQPTYANQISMPTDPAGYASTLYAALHQLERTQTSLIEIEKPPQDTEWSAVWDRLQRSAG